MSSPNQPTEHWQSEPVPNGIPPPPFDLPYPENPDTITANITKLFDLTPDARTKFVFKNLIKHLHAFVNETSITTEEWEKSIQFLTRVGQKCTPIRQEFILLSDIFGVSALVGSLNNPPIHGATESSVLGPFKTDDAPDVLIGDSIASEGKGDYMYVEGRVTGSDGKPVSNAVIETWETDGQGTYDTQYTVRDKPECRGRIHTGSNGEFGYRAVVPVPYPIPGDGPVGELLMRIGRHNMRPSHLHFMVEAPGYHRLVTALYPEGDEWLASDAVFGVKKSLIVKLEDVNDDAEARKRGFPKGGSFKLLKRDIVLVSEFESASAREKFAAERAQKVTV